MTSTVLIMGALLGALALNLIKLASKVLIKELAATYELG